jgi:hypothetical protein
MGLSGGPIGRQRPYDNQIHPTLRSGTWPTLFSSPIFTTGVKLKTLASLAQLNIEMVGEWHPGE